VVTMQQKKINILSAELAKVKSKVEEENLDHAEMNLKVRKFHRIGGKAKEASSEADKGIHKTLKINNLLSHKVDDLRQQVEEEHGKRHQLVILGDEERYKADAVGNKRKRDNDHKLGLMEKQTLLNGDHATCSKEMQQITQTLKQS
jgi:hypothetical protein